MNTESFAELQKRLRWQARRGMLELDLILEKFIESGLQELNAAEVELFQEMLKQPDPVLYDWLYSKKIPDDAKMQSLVVKCRAFGT